MGEEKFEIVTGDAAFIPLKVQHAFIQKSEHGKMIVSYLPAGKMEAFFAVADQWTRPPSKVEIANVFAEHEMKIVGPPLKMDEPFCTCLFQKW